MQAKDLCPYQENKAKYFVPKRIRGFQEGLDEIEKTPLVKFIGNASEKSKMLKNGNKSEKKVCEK